MGLRNSIQMFARAYFSHKQLHKKKTADIHEMLHNKGLNWADLTPEWKNGMSVFKQGIGCRWTAVGNKIFSQDRKFIERYLENGY